MKTTPGHIRISDAMWERLHPSDDGQPKLGQLWGIQPYEGGPYERVRLVVYNGQFSGPNEDGHWRAFSADQLRTTGDYLGVFKP